MENRKQLDFLNDFLEDDEAIFRPKTLEQVAAIRPLTVDELIVKQYKLGMTLKQITKENGLSYGKVYEIINRMGVPLRHGRDIDSKSGHRITTMSSLEKSSLVADYKAGFSVRDLLERYRINKHGLYSLLDKAKVPRRHKSNTVLLDIGKIREAQVPQSQQEPFRFWQDGTQLNVVIRKDLMEGMQTLKVSIEGQEQ